ncbi:unnamed protein product [Rhizophagus irregularis]|nr:unnamed protein product [Rhizophagus irregularis]
MEANLKRVKILSIVSEERIILSVIKERVSKHKFQNHSVHGIGSSHQKLQFRKLYSLIFLDKASNPFLAFSLKQILFNLLYSMKNFQFFFQFF